MSKQLPGWWRWWHVWNSLLWSGSARLLPGLDVAGVVGETGHVTAEVFIRYEAVWGLAARLALGADVFGRFEQLVADAWKMV